MVAYVMTIISLILLSWMTFRTERMTTGFIAFLEKRYVLSFLKNCVSISPINDT